MVASTSRPASSTTASSRPDAEEAARPPSTGRPTAVRPITVGSVRPGMPRTPTRSAAGSRRLVGRESQTLGTLALFYSRLAHAFDAERDRALERDRPRVPRRPSQNAFALPRVQELAATDARTGFGNRAASHEALPREISAARRYGRPLRCLIQIDLDDFGAINKRSDSPTTGDAVLTEFGERVRATIRGSDAAFRNSGGADEFFLILPETTRERAKLLYRRLAFEMATPPLASSTLPSRCRAASPSSAPGDTATDAAPARRQRAAASAKETARTALCTRRRQRRRVPKSARHDRPRRLLSCFPPRRAVHCG